jgi:WD40 repeat protein
MTDARPVVKVFISSPGDVRPERLTAERVVRRLDREFAYHLEVRAVLWEREPLVAAHHFQDQIPPPRESDVVVLILWSRLGVLLPDSHPGPLSGKPVTGTEWEFEDALKSCRERQLPDLLVYRKRAQVTASLADDAALEERRTQKRLVDGFMERWFLGEGGTSFTSAFRDFVDTGEFEEQLEEHLRALLLKRIGGGVAGALATIRWHQGSPYRGLLSFDVEHSAIFFGRTRARNELRELLQAQVEAGSAFVLVMGASGSGKSSLVKAALLPDLRLPGMLGHVALVRHAVLRPGDGAGSPLHALAAALRSTSAFAELAPDEGTLEALLRSDPAAALGAIRDALSLVRRGGGLTELGEARLVVIVDQLEELFTMESCSGVERDAFVAALEALARSGFVWVVATMRSDFFERLENVPALARLSAKGRFLLSLPEPAEIAQIIRQPAREAGITFETDPTGGITLDEVIRQAAERDPGALPLLSFLLDQLWQRRSPSGVLTFDAYHELGGLEGALGRRAEDFFATLPPDIQAALPGVLRELVTVSQGANAVVTARACPLDTFPPGSAERALVEHLLDPAARLLVADRSGEHVLLRVAHEALLTHWERARAGIRSNWLDLQLRARLEAAAAQWRSAPAEHRSSLLLRRGLPVSEAEDLLARRGAALGADVLAFVRESAAAVRAEARRSLRRLQAVVAGLSVLTAIAVVLAWWAWDRSVAAREREQLALKNESLFLTRTALELAQSGAHERASLVLAAALPATVVRPDRPLVPEAMAALARVSWEDRLVGVLRGHGAPVDAVAFSPGGDRVVTAAEDDTAALWDAGTGARLAVLRGHGDWVVAAAFSPDGELLVTASNDGTARLWSARTGVLLRSLEGHRDRLTAVAFAPDGTRAVTASYDGTARIWDVATGAPVAALGAHRGPVHSAAFDREGSRVVTASADRTARVWDARTGSLLATLSGHENAVRAAAFSPDGEGVATASFDRTARLWDSRTGALLHVLRGHDEGLNGLWFSRDGRTLVTSSYDRTARAWDARSGRALASFQGHEDWVRSAAISPDGTRVVTASYDRTARIWDVASGGEVAVLGGHGGVVLVAAFDASGDRVITAGADGLARIWDARGHPSIAIFRGPGDPVHAVAFSADGERVATGGSDRSVRTWNARTGAPLLATVAWGKWLRDVSWSPTADRIVAADSDGTARIIDGRTGSLFETLGPLDGAMTRARFDRTGVRVVTANADGRARVFDVATGAELLRLEGHAGPLESAAFGPGDARIVTASSDETARVWDARSGAQLVVLKGHAGAVYSAVFSPDGERIVTASHDKTARVWDARTGRQLLLLSGHERTVRSAEFSPSGERIVTASRDGTARVWDARTGLQLAVLSGHRGEVLSATFSSTGERVATASSDGTARVWDVALLSASAADLLDRLHATQLRELDPFERRAMFMAPAPFRPEPRDGARADPAAAREQVLAEQLERAGTGRLADALLHHARAAALARRAGDEETAALETARRGTLARNLDLASALREWRRLEPVPR